MNKEDPLFQLRVTNLIQKVKHYLITTMGRVAEEATREEIYKVLVHALREEIMIHWTASTHTWTAEDSRMIYYLSMEYLPGRVLSQNLANLNALELVNAVLAGLGRKLEEIRVVETDPGLGNGGLGRLASCFLDSFATQDIPAVAYGLRYQYGIFEQELWEGVQIERPDCWLLYENPWEFRRDNLARTIHFGGHPMKVSDEFCDTIGGEEVRALPYDIPIVGLSDGRPFSVVTLRLWSTKESPRNFELQRYNSGQLDQAVENTLLTDVLYPNDNHETGKRIRLKQEYLLASASCQDILRSYLSSHPDLSGFSDKVRIQVNDTHPALIVPELMWRLMRDHHLSFNKAWETVSQTVSYTNHTILREALEEWNEARIKNLIPCHHAIIEEINFRFCNSVRIRYPGDEERIQRVSIIEKGQIHMAHLLLAVSHRVNGVAALHTEILKTRLFKDFYELYPERFLNVTNGVTPRRWILACNPELAALISQEIGDGWILRFEEIAQLKNSIQKENVIQAFQTIKKANKERLLAFLQEEGRLHNRAGERLFHFFSIDSSWLLDVQIKRFHEYKRQLMNLLHTIILYHELLENPDSHKVKRAVLFAGKAAPGYEAAKNILRLIYCVARRINHDERTKDKLQIILVENYNVSRAEMIIPAADLSEQISTAGMEASGTGNMKLAMNGALTIGTPDGANIEMHEAIGDESWPFGFGATSEELSRQEGYQPWKQSEQHPDIARALESLVDRSFAENLDEHEIFAQIHQSLTEGFSPDRYYVLYDLPAYQATQRAVEALFLQPDKWAETALHNIASMGRFSIDSATFTYAEKIWGITPCPPSGPLLNKVREDYSEHDKCRILQ